MAPTAPRPEPDAPAAAPRGEEAGRFAGLGDREFAAFSALLFELAGVHLTPAKKPLVAGRLAKRLAHHRLTSYGEYLALVRSGAHPGERQRMLDALTTHETSFFREPQHFELLRDRVLAEWRGQGAPFRAWSAACSTGEEVYSLAMTLAESLGDRPWEVLGTDVSEGAVAHARRGLYPMTRAARIPKALLLRHCLRGVRAQAGSFLVDRGLRARVRFEQRNLLDPQRDLGQFQVIMLRNVLIYFDLDTRRKVLGRLVPQLAPGGHLFVGHAESLNGVTDALELVRPTVYRKA